jgi:hypothetical protein
LAEVDLPVVVKARNPTAADATDFEEALVARFARQMMKHGDAEDNVEGRIGERELLNEHIFEAHLDHRLARFLLRPRNHLRGCVDSPDLP